MSEYRYDHREIEQRLRLGQFVTEDEAAAVMERRSIEANHALRVFYFKSRSVLTERQNGIKCRFAENRTGEVTAQN